MIYWFLFVAIFILGLVIGSFINALEYRIDKGMSLTRGRSICPKCQKQLAWYDNIPLISYIILRGKCRQCGRDISLQYPVVELITGVSFVAIAIKLDFLNKASAFIVRVHGRELLLVIIALIALLFITFCLILVALHDQKTSYVLSAYIYAAIAASIVYLEVTYTGTWAIRDVLNYLLPNILASLAAMTPFAILYLVSRGAWMGVGDIEIAALLGFLLGWPHFLVALYFAFIVGSAWGLVKVYLMKDAKLKSEIPFAPFLIAGILFTLLFGQQLTALYVKIFLG